MLLYVVEKKGARRGVGGGSKSRHPEKSSYFYM